MIVKGKGRKILFNNLITSVVFPFEIDSGDDLVYEVVRLIDGYPLFWNEHMKRLINSLNLIGLDGNEIVKDITPYLVEYIAQNEFKNNNIRIVLTNFNGKKFDYIVYNVMSYYPDDEQYEYGVKLASMEFERNRPNAKIVNSNLVQMADTVKQDAGAYEVALVNKDGYITEGSKSNLFFIKKDKIYLSHQGSILKGITLTKLLELFDELGLKYIEDNIEYSKLDSYDSVFITGTSNNVLPVESIDSYKFRSGKDLIILWIMKEFNKVIKKDIKEYKNIIISEGE